MIVVKKITALLKNIWCLRIHSISYVKIMKQKRKLKEIILQWGYIMTEQLTLKELHKILGELIADGYGNRTFELWYDNEMRVTSIPKGSSITIISKAIRFTDYDDGKTHYIVEGVND